jgi:hypothetical protein
MGIATSAQWDEVRWDVVCSNITHCRNTGNVNRMIKKILTRFAFDRVVLHTTL